MTGGVLELIGNTPLVALPRIAAGLPSRILAKAELLNPGGSIKDRPALWIIREQVAAGRLRPGDSVVEMTSGNMGCGLAIVCAQYGLPFVAVMSAGNSVERAQMMRACGARVELVPQAPGGVAGRVSGADLDLARARTDELVAELGAYRVDQFNNPLNLAAHEQSTGPEIWRQSGGAVDAFVTAPGTGCTFVGVMRHLRAQSSRIRGYVAEPDGAAVLGGGLVTRTQHTLQGTGYATVPSQWDPELCDGSIPVTDDEALEMCRRLAAEEGWLVGYSSGANVAAAVRLAREPNPPATIVTVLCDSGLKYLRDGPFCGL